MLDAVGKTLSGHYKRAGKAAIEVVMEVTALAQIVDRFGQIHAYLFGTRMDTGAEGNVVLMRRDCFKPDSVKVSPAKDFKPIEGFEDGEWMVTPPGDASASFAFVERINDAEDRNWASTLGAKPLADLLVKPAPVKAPRAKRHPKAEGLVPQLEA